ncbi:hypothetical protein LJC57_06970 [Parabacteroides sp. OttesenSCG-928-G07]|nr:hypothetical protein [Parabacteroides sp. OttesenSCG-928-G21]MDL2278318.1 hypothetical protein [Parabacteroides sp. OttesenSCG-928-G07]
MKKKGDDVFKQFRDSFGSLSGHFHVLEQRVPLEVQMEYFKNSERLRDADMDSSLSDDEESVKAYEGLLSEETTADEKKRILSLLAISKSIKAYRLLEKYSKQPDPVISDWAYMALMESRISLESELSDEKQIYISTGLGGRDEKLRFYVLILSVGGKSLQDYQRQVVEREFEYYLPQKGCEIERLTIEDKYVELLFLLPVKADIKGILDQVITECNQYGNFLSPIYTITNVKELTPQEIEDLIRKNGDNKASN